MVLCDSAAAALLLISCSQIAVLVISLLIQLAVELFLADVVGSLLVLPPLVHYPQQ
jgi:hypothetical protein